MFTVQAYNASKIGLHALLTCVGRGGRLGPKLAMASVEGLGAMLGEWGPPMIGPVCPEGETCVVSDVGRAPELASIGYGGKYCVHSRRARASSSSKVDEGYSACLKVEQVQNTRGC